MNLLRLFKRNKPQAISTNSNAGVKTRKRNVTKKVYLTPKKLLPLVREDEIFDEETLHKLTTDGREQKFCTGCEKWVDIDKFYKDSHTRDGLHSRCMECSKKKDEERRKKKLAQSRAQKREKRPKGVNPTNSTPNNKKHKPERNRYKENIKCLKKENDALKQKLQKCLDTFSAIGLDYTVVSTALNMKKKKQTQKELLDYIKERQIPMRALLDILSKYSPMPTPSNTSKTTETVRQAS